VQYCHCNMGPLPVCLCCCHAGVLLIKVAYHIQDIRMKAAHTLGRLLMTAPPFRPLLEGDASSDREVLLAEVRRCVRHT
jgi:hypothetical protein